MSDEAAATAAAGQQRRPRFQKTKLDKDNYLVISDDQTRLFLVSRYEEDGSAWQGAGPNQKQVLGPHWWIRMLEKDLTDGWPELGIGPEAVVTRDQTGRITALNRALVGDADWKDINNTIPTLAEAWRQAAFTGDSGWLDEREGRG